MDPSRDKTDDLVLLELRLERLERRLERNAEYNVISIWLRGLSAILVLLAGIYALFSGFPIPQTSYDIGLVILLTFFSGDAALKYYRHRNTET